MDPDRKTCDRSRRAAHYFIDRAAAGRSAKQLAEDLEAFLVGRLAVVGFADPQIAFLRRAAGFAPAFTVTKGDLNVGRRGPP